MTARCAHGRVWYRPCDRCAADDASRRGEWTADQWEWWVAFRLAFYKSIGLKSTSETGR